MSTTGWRLLAAAAVFVVALVFLSASGALPYLILTPGGLWPVALFALLLVFRVRVVNEITLDVVPDSWVRDHGSREG